MKKIVKDFTINDLITFAVTAIIMLVAHGFSFTNLMFSHDSLYYHVTDYFTKFETGRWMYPILLQIRGFAAPWMMGMLSTIYVSASAVLVSRILCFDRIKSICVAFLFAANISLVVLFATYSYDADADTLALFMACLAVYALENFGGKARTAVAIIATIICLASYQAYICVALGLVLILLIKKAAVCKNDKELGSVFIAGVKDYLVLLVGAIIYLIPILLAVTVLGVDLSGYNGAGRVSDLSIGSLLTAIPLAYIKFIKKVAKMTIFNNNAGVVALVLAAAATVVSFVKFVRAKRGYLGSLKLIVPCLVLMPLFLNAIYLVSFGTLHELMTYAFCLVFLLPFVFSDLVGSDDRPNQNKVIIPTVLAIAILSFNTIVYANGAYTYKKLVYDNTLLHAHKIWEDVNAMEGYVDGETPVIFVGSFPDSKAAYRSSVGDKYRDILVGAFDSSMTYEHSIDQFYYGILGRDMVVISDYTEKSENMAASMNEYPSEGYCKWTDSNDAIVVKLSKSVN